MDIIESIRVDEAVTLISFEDFPADMDTVAAVFAQIADAGVDVDMISQCPLGGTHSGLSFTVRDADFGQILPIVTGLRAKNKDLRMSVSSGNCKISVFGEQMNGLPGVAARVFRAAAGAGADLRLITTSETDISLLVVPADTEGTVRAIAEAFA